MLCNLQNPPTKFCEIVSEGLNYRRVNDHQKVLSSGEGMKNPNQERQKLEGARLKAVRKSLDLNQTDFANKFGITRQTLSRYEKGHSRIPQHIRLQIIQEEKVDILPGNSREPIQIFTARVQELKTQRELISRNHGFITAQFNKIKALSARHTQAYEELCRPFKWISNVISFIFLTATFIFAIEKIQRATIGWNSSVAYHDFLYIISAILIISLLPSAALIISTIKTKP